MIKLKRYSYNDKIEVGPNSTQVPRKEKNLTVTNFTTHITYSITIKNKFMFFIGQNVHEIHSMHIYMVCIIFTGNSISSTTSHSLGLFCYPSLYKFLSFL